MIDLYGMSSPNVYKVAIMLEEAELPYRMHYVDVFAEEQFRPDFLKISPTGKVPAITDPVVDGGDPLTLCESGAILIYLAEKSGRLLPSASALRAEAIQWLMVQMASIGPMFGQYAHFLFYARDNAYGLSRYERQVGSLLALLECRLAAAAFLGGQDCSVADVATYPWIRRALEIFPGLKSDGTALLAEAHPHLARWYETVAARPAVKRAFERMAPWRDRTVRSARAASPAGMDRFLARPAVAPKRLPSGDFRAEPLSWQSD